MSITTWEELDTDEIIEKLGETSKLNSEKVKSGEKQSLNPVPKKNIAMLKLFGKIISKSTLMKTSLR